MEQAQFEDLMHRLRQGDSAAADEFVSYFEPELRRIARVRLRDPRLQSLADSVDISQSVFGKFFQRYSADGQIQTKEQLLALLATMTKNRVIDLARKHKSPADNPADGSNTGSTERPSVGQRFSPREVCQIGDLDAMLSESGPSTVVTSQDLAAHIRRKLSDEEYDLVVRRNQGQSWSDIADAIGRSAESMRKQLARALERVRHEIEMEIK